MNIMITGIHGFVGSNIVSRLKQQHTRPMGRLFLINLVLKKCVLSDCVALSLSKGRSISVPKKIREVLLDPCSKEIYYGIFTSGQNGKDVDDFRPKYFLFLP